MLKFLGKWIHWLTATNSEEIKGFKLACDELVNKYESLLKQISDYMQENQIPLRSFEQSGEIHLNNITVDIQLNTFSLFTIKDELLNITHECENLLHHGSTHFTERSLHMDTVNALLSQLQELRKYSEQIEGALGEFEDKLIKMEEVLAENSLWN